MKQLEKGRIYAQGSMQKLSEITGWTGSKVLYFGDSLWADLVDARRLKGWRTVRVVLCCACDHSRVPFCMFNRGKSVGRWMEPFPITYHHTHHSTPTIHAQGAVIRELEDELRVQQSPAYRAHAHKAILMTELLRLVQVCAR